MKEIDYLVLIKMISDGEIRPDGLKVEDQNGLKWFWKDGNFVMTMRDGDTEPPYLYLTDKYNVVDLYSLRFKVPTLDRPDRQPR